MGGEAPAGGADDADSEAMVITRLCVAWENIWGAAGQPPLH